MVDVRLTAIGYLTHDPQVITFGQCTYTRFSLGDRASAGRPEDSGQPLRFVAFGKVGAGIARVAREGDQLAVTARALAATPTCEGCGASGALSFVVKRFRFGPVAP
jgi:single-stranded DNA-binding protein